MKYIFCDCDQCGNEIRLDVNLSGCTLERDEPEKSGDHVEFNGAPMPRLAAIRDGWVLAEHQNCIVLVSPSRSQMTAVSRAVKSHEDMQIPWPVVTSAVDALERIARDGLMVASPSRTASQGGDQ